MTTADDMDLQDPVDQAVTPLHKAAAIGHKLCAPVLKSRFVDPLLAVFFVVVLALVTTFSFLRPSPNWDALAYFALALEAPGDSAAEKHAKAYGAVREHASAAQFETLTRDDEYRQRQFSDPKAFQSMMPMYAVKAGYIVALKALEPSLGIARAAQAINLAAILVISLLCLWWMRQGGFLQASPLILAVILMLETRALIGGVTPDLAAAALTLCAVYVLWRGRDWLALPLLVGATTFRPDTLLFAFALMLAFSVTRERLVAMAATFAACLAAYFALTSGSDHIGWWTHFWFSNVHYQNDMTGFAPDFSLFAYLKGLARGTIMSLTYFNWPLLGLVLVGGWAMLVRRGYAIAGRTNALLVALLLVMGGKFVTFPLPDDRIYMAFVLGGTMLLLSIWRPRVLD